MQHRRWVLDILEPWLQRFFLRCTLLIFAALWLQCHKAVAAAPPGSVDLLDAFRLGDNPAVTTASGFCETREGQKKPDVAYKLTKKAVISIPTATVFPGKLVKAVWRERLIMNNFYLDGFPFDFSILTTFRTTSASRGQLFTAYSADGSLILSVKIARRIVFIYKGDGGGRKERLRFKLKLSHQKWVK